MRHASNIFIQQVCGASRTFLVRKFHINFKAIGILEWCCYWCGVNNVSLIGLIRITPWKHQSASKPLLRLLVSLPLQCKLPVVMDDSTNHETSAQRSWIRTQRAVQSVYAVCPLTTTKKFGRALILNAPFHLTCLEGPAICLSCLCCR